MMFLETSSPRFSAFGEVGVAAGKGLPAWRTPNIKLEPGLIGTRTRWETTDPVATQIESPMALVSREGRLENELMLHDFITNTASAYPP